MDTLYPYQENSLFYSFVEDYKESVKSVLYYYTDENFRFIKRKDDLVFYEFIITSTVDSRMTELRQDFQKTSVIIQSVASSLGLQNLPLRGLLINLGDEIKGLFSDKESTVHHYVGQDTLKFLKDSGRLIEGLAYFITVFPFLTEDDFPNRKAQVRDFVFLAKSVTNEGKPKDNVTFWMEAFPYTMRMIQSLTSGTQPEEFFFDETGEGFSLEFADPFIVRRFEISGDEDFLFALCEMGGSMVQRDFLEGDNA